MKWNTGPKRKLTQDSRGIFAKFLEVLLFMGVLSRNAWSIRKSCSAVPIQIERDFKSAEELGDAFRLHGSDKSTHHDYERIYSNLIPRHLAKSVLEIGIGSNNLDTPQNMGVDGVPGASLRAWQSWFPNAAIIGGDIDSRILFQEYRISTYWVDQLVPESIVSICQQSLDLFDLVIIDGLHTPIADLNSLIYTIPFVRSGGYIVIEDISPNSAKSVWIFLKLVLSKRGGSTLIKMKNGHLFLFQKQISS
jgi:hypothetical protein